MSISCLTEINIGLYLPILHYPQKHYGCLFSKTYHVTGWRVVMSLAPAELTKEIRKVYQFIAFSASTPMQHAIAAFA